MNNSLKSNYEFVRENSNPNFRNSNKISNITQKLLSFVNDSPHYHKANIFLSPPKTKNINTESEQSNYFYSTTNPNVYTKKGKNTTISNITNYNYNPSTNHFNSKNYHNKFIYRNRKNSSLLFNQDINSKTN